MIYERFRKVKIRFSCKVSELYPEDFYRNACIELLETLKNFYEENRDNTSLHSLFFNLPPGWDEAVIDHYPESTVYKWVIDYPVSFGNEDALFTALEESRVFVSVEE